MDTLIHFGGSVKALGDGRVGGYLIMFGDAATTDLVGDYFTKDTDFDLEDGKRTAVYYAHGLDKKIGPRRIGTGTMKADDVGVWLEAQLNLRDAYEQEIYGMAQKEKLGWSSGTANHLVTRKAIKTEGGTVHEIKTWPLGLDSSLTPTPAEPRIHAVALKSLSALIGLQPEVENHTTKALPSGMSYDDLRAFLQDELNEDIGDDDDPYGPGLWICDIYDDAVVYRDDEDLFRIPYTVTAGNDAVWGTPESVVRTTVYVTATDGDDDAAETNDAVSMMAGKQADVTAIKEQLTRSMPFGTHADVATSAMEGFVTRAANLTEMSIKAGRVISAANRDKLAKIHAGMQTAHTAMSGHLQAINDMLLSTDPQAKKDIDDFAALRTRHVRLQSELLHLVN